eukprot:scaffold39165_cov180-Skeletonema_marinoi.AAC.3
MQHNSLDAHIEIICIVTSAVVFQLTKDPATFLLPPSQGAEGCLLASRFEVAKKKSKNCERAMNETRGSVEKGELKPGGARAVPEDARGACWVRVGRRRWMANALVQARPN